MPDWALPSKWCSPSQQPNTLGLTARLTQSARPIKLWGMLKLLRTIVCAMALGTCFVVVFPARQNTAAEPTAALGVIEGVVTYEPDPQRPWRYRRYYVRDRNAGFLAEAVVCLSESPPKDPAPASEPQSWKIDQKDYRFIPETLAVQAGDEITFTNSDPLLHDVTLSQRTGVTAETVRSESLSLQQRQVASRTFSDAGGIGRPVTLSCRFHSSMRGWIYVFDHPFFQVTEPDGRFRLVGVPPGRRTLQMIHSAGQLRWKQDVDVQAGGITSIQIRVSPDNLFTE